MRMGIEQRFRKPKFLDREQYERAFEASFDVVEKNIQENLEATMKTWSKKAKVVVIRSGYRQWGAITGRVDSKLWNWINDGTPERIIKPRKARVLVFRRGFKSKTVPNRVLSRTGKRFGDFVFAKSVRHKIRARRWDILIDKEAFDVFKREINRNIKRASEGKL